MGTVQLWCLDSTNIPFPLPNSHTSLGSLPNRSTLFYKHTSTSYRAHILSHDRRLTLDNLLCHDRKCHECQASSRHRLLSRLRHLPSRRSHHSPCYLHASKSASNLPSILHAAARIQLPSMFRIRS